jgi:predicted ATP-binding protein involved in virulence
MQRRLLGDLTAAFPDVRFIVSTHSPLIVTSLKEAAVYALRYRGPGDVISQRLDLQGQVRTATEVLDEVLGVSSTMPLWAEAELAAVISAFTQGPLDEKSFQLLRERLKKLGLADFMPQALGQILDAQK